MLCVDCGNAICDWCCVYTALNAICDWCCVQTAGMLYVTGVVCTLMECSMTCVVCSLGMLLVAGVVCRL